MNFKFLNLIGFIAVVIINGLANALPIGGRTTGEVSGLYDNLFVPAGFTFSVWGIIYLALLLYVLFPFIKKDKVFTQTNKKISPLFLGTCIVNMVWIFSWHHLLIPITWILMVMLLTLLIMVYRELRKTQNTSNSRLLFQSLPFSLYLGWISVATVANSTALLVNYGLNEYLQPEYIWLVIMVLVAFLLGVTMLMKFHDTIYATVIIWAFIGIYSNLKGGVYQENQWILTPLIFAITLAIFTIWKMVRQERLYLFD